METTNSLPRIAISGPGRSGKDEAAEYLKRHGFRYSESTSCVITREIARQTGLSFEECHAKRHEHRGRWYHVGNQLREKDPAHLVREVLKTGNVVVGVRDGIEMRAAREKGLVDLVVWIDRDVPPDPTLTYGTELADIIIPNHEGLPEFHARLDRLACLICKPPKQGRESLTLAHALGRAESVASVIENGFPAFGEWMVDGHVVKTAGGDGASDGPRWNPQTERHEYLQPADRPEVFAIPEPPKPPTAALPSLGGLPRDEITLYLSGPMTGILDFNFPMFDRVAATLRHRGWRVVSPADFGHKPGDTWESHLQRDLFLVGQCDALVQLPGWEESKGATLEHLVAERFSKHVLSLTEVLDMG